MSKVQSEVQSGKYKKLKTYDYQKHTMFLIVCLFFIVCAFFPTMATSSSMVICDYDTIVHRWLAFETNASFLDHSQDLIAAHCSRLRDLFHDEESHEDEEMIHEDEEIHEDENELENHEDELANHEDELESHEDEFFVNATEL
jgi:hypothetical protein